MFLFRIIFVGALIAGAMILIKQDRVLERAGLIGSCRVVGSPAGDTGEWRACRSGKLAGRPDLSVHSCESKTLQGDTEYWRCPAPLAANRAAQ